MTLLTLNKALYKLKTTYYPSINYALLIAEDNVVDSLKYQHILVP